MNVLLTSCGLETEDIKKEFLKMLDKDALTVRALFIPTAAIYPDAINVLPKCMNDLLKCGILKENITVYDLHSPMAMDQLREYDVVYLCGGDPKYLLYRINEQQFNHTLLQYIKEDGLVIGVSAGSIIFADNLKENLGLLRQQLYVHCSEEECEPVGAMDVARKEPIKLGNRQAIVIDHGATYIIS